MTTFQDVRDGHRGGEWLRRLLAGFAVLLVLGLPVTAGDDDPQLDENGGPSDNDGGGGNFFGDETVGTLPATGGSGALRGQLYGQSFSIQGTAFDLMTVVTDVEGFGLVDIVQVDAATDTWRMTFRGQYYVTLDRERLSSSSLTTGLWVDDISQGALARILWRRRSTTVELGTGGFDLPLPQMVRSGALQDGPLGIYSASRTGTSTYVQVWSEGDYLVVSQIRR